MSNVTSAWWTITSTSSAVKADLFEVILSEDVEKVKRIFGSIPPHVENEDGETPLLVSARIGNANLVRFFLESGGDPNAKDDEMFSSLLNAAKYGYVEVCELLIEAGASLEDEDVAGWTPLCWAVYKNKVSVVRLLIAKGARVNLIDEHGMSPLMWASARGYVEVVQMLLDAGAKVEIRDRFGNNSLIWACRRNNVPIVKALLKAGSNADVVGMKGLTALLLATKCNNMEMVIQILTKPCELNAVDHRGYTATINAVQNGNTEMVEKLLEAGASVNMSEQLRENVLMRAVKLGSLEIVRLLLEKHVNIDYQDHEGRTALHLATDKNLLEIASLLLEHLPNLELKNHDGDTPLLRAVRNRNLPMAQLLKMAGANVGTTDKNGDTSLHIAVRCRSRRMVQLLMAPPFDSRILYQPNRIKETPYSIDRASNRPVLRHIFGPLDSALKTEAMMGYELYSSVLADILCAPNLSLPIFVGLYAKWGSGKAFLLRKVKEALQLLSRSWFTPTRFNWSWSVALGINLCVLLFGSSKNTRIRDLNLYISHHMAFVRLTFKIIFFNPPSLSERDLISCPISFLFADYRRLSNFECEHALNNIIDSLYGELECHYGRVPVRLARAIHTSLGKHRHPKLRRVCGVPLLLVVALLAVLFIFALYLCLLYWGDMFSGPFLFGTIALSSVVLITVGPMIFLCIRAALVRPRRAMKSLLYELENLRFEAFMEKLCNEVELLDRTISRLDAYTRSQTRLVILMDGLDSCEGSRIVQTLDAVQVLFGRPQNSRFIVLISVDPHVVLLAVRNNLQSAFLQSEVSSYDYLKMIIHMSLYLRNSEFLKLHQQLAIRQAKTFDSNRLRVLMRQETVGGSYWSISESCRGSVRSPKPSSGPANAVPFGPEIVRDDYFSDINPRSLRRVVNALSLTGRLMRAFEIEFSWVTLAHWISLIEQWPYRMSWLIEYSNHCKLPDELTLKEVYNDIKDRIPTDNEMFVEMDRNQKGLDSYFHSEVEPQLCLSHMRTFIPFSSNLDPYVRRLIRGGQCVIIIYRVTCTECSDKLEEMEAPAEEHNNNVGISEEGKPCKDTVPLGVLKLFRNPVWQNVRLSVLTTQEVVNFLRKLPLSSVEATERYANSCHSANISGLVLSLCNLDTLKQELRMSFGDWEIFALIVNHLRAREASLQDEGKLSEPVTSLTNEDCVVTRYLDSIDREDAVEIPSSYVSSRCSSVTFEHAELDGNKEAVNSELGAPHLSVCFPSNDKYHREKISCETTYSAKVDANRKLLNSSDSEDESTQLTVQLKTAPSRPSILPRRKMTRASSEPGIGFEKLVIEDVQK
ncbi:Ank and Ank 2 and KAP NTPase and Ank 4 domain con taining protein [Trichuris trichiura]|uniref:Ank and Ank 2 and KAP NTPase and Ank 4 domain con taining protein n=1 Tax=Trichuris trichiura TaxID=36087 RepID=A0A077Z1B2_TRITR|nr:Ank and Ank 2 and KAP NTPase and Ank 4 domain con taining protein [Trichuris trichiura]